MSDVIACDITVTSLQPRPLLVARWSPVEGPILSLRKLISLMSDVIPYNMTITSLQLHLLLVAPVQYCHLCTTNESYIKSYKCLKHNISDYKGSLILLWTPSGDVIPRSSYLLTAQQLGQQNFPSYTEAVRTFFQHFWYNINEVFELNSSF